jgi:hypothetical protein
MKSLRVKKTRTGKRDGKKDEEKWTFLNYFSSFGKYDLVIMELPPEQRQN